MNAYYAVARVVACLPSKKKKIIYTFMIQIIKRYAFSKNFNYTENHNKINYKTLLLI